MLLSLTSLITVAAAGLIRRQATQIQYAPGQTSTVLSPPTADTITPSAALEANPSFNFTGIAIPEPVRGQDGLVFTADPDNTSGVAGGTDHDTDRNNPDTLAPPSTDYGTVAQLKWPLSLSHNRLEDGGWARQQNDMNLPAATAAAGVQFKLAPYAYREMHWHSNGEWSYMFQGSARISVVNQNGQNYVADINQGDLWFFPEGVPHNIQALENGCEFLLVFDSGTFNEDDTLLITELFAHLPKEVLAKNFNLPISAFNGTPDEQKYIFRGTNPGTLASQNITGPAGYSGVPYSYAFSKVPFQQVQGGQLKIVDSTNFPPTTLAAAEVIIEPGGIREIHWHFVDEWNYFISGKARITVFESGAARTFDYQAGDVGYIPVSDGHYIENIGTEPVHMLEILKTPVFQDVSMGNWLALTSANTVMETLNIDQETYDGIHSMYASKQYIVK